MFVRPPQPVPQHVQSFIKPAARVAGAVAATAMPAVAHAADPSILYSLYTAGGGAVFLAALSLNTLGFVANPVFGQFDLIGRDVAAQMRARGRRVEVFEQQRSWMLLANMLPFVLGWGALWGAYTAVHNQQFELGMLGAGLSMAMPVAAFFAQLVIIRAMTRSVDYVVDVSVRSPWTQQAREDLAAVAEDYSLCCSYWEDLQEIERARNPGMGRALADAGIHLEALRGNYDLAASTQDRHEFESAQRRYDDALNAIRIVLSEFYRQQALTAALPREGQLGGATGETREVREVREAKQKQEGS